MIAYLLALIIAFYPYTISLPASDLAPGATYTATISAPAGASVAVKAPAWLDVGPVRYVSGETWQASVTARGDNAIGRIELWVDGVRVADTGVRVGTPHTIWLPWTANAPAG